MSTSQKNNFWVSALDKIEFIKSTKNIKAIIK